MSYLSRPIETPADPALGELAELLAGLADGLDTSGNWPAQQLDWCAQYGVFSWFAPRAWGGREWSEEDIIRGYLALSAACLTTTFVITQRTGACQRIERSGNEEIKRRLLPDLIQGKFFATVGISHLTTSRRHLSQPVLRATETGSGFVLDGYSPWVTGGGQARYVVLGATLADGREILVTVPTDSPGVKASPPQPLVGLSASHTGAVVCHQVPVPREWVLAGPIQDVIKQGWGARTGGLQTSTLALGLAESAIRFLETESQRRPEIGHPALALRDEGEELKTALLHAARQQPVCTDAELRTRANSLVLRATQSALGAAKGSGYVAGHPVGRWCREALFFLVWSCPQPVLNANLCEFAGIEG